MKPMKDGDHSLIGLQNRAFGLLFILSPLGNLILTIWQKNLGSWRSMNNILNTAAKISPFTWVIFAVNLAAGISLLASGSRRSRVSERLAMGALTLNLLQNLATISEDLKGGRPQAIIPLLINMALFIWFYSEASVRIGSYLGTLRERIQKGVQDNLPARMPQGLTQNFTRGFAKHLAKDLRAMLPKERADFILRLDPGLPVQLGSGAPWARIVEVTQGGLRIRPNAKELVPPEARTRALEFVLEPGESGEPRLAVRARYSGESGEDILFRYLEARPLPRKRLEDWSRKIVKKRTGRF